MRHAKVYSGKFFVEISVWKLGSFVGQKACSSPKYTTPHSTLPTLLATSALFSTNTSLFHFL